MKNILRFFGITILFVLLTLLTQVGGIFLLLSIFITRKFQIQTGLKKMSLFVLIYVLATLIIIPTVAKVFGRVALPISSKGLVAPNNLLMCLLNRHYVKPKLYQLIHDVAGQMNTHDGTTIRIRYLDANFPFINGFPLLPHRSHDDGEKLDIAFMYLDKVKGTFWDDRVSFVGYGFCEVPFRNEINMPRQCSQKGYWQYSLLTKSFGLVSHEEVQFDEFTSEKILKLLSKHLDTKKIFIEPHLKSRLGFANDSKIRFHGCKAVRHDDHIHIEL